MIELRTPTGQTLRVSDDRADFWEARGYARVTPKPEKAPAKKAAKKAPAKRAAKKSTSKKK